MKPNEIVPSGPLRLLFVGRWEKWIFAAAAVACLCLFGASLARSPYSETPDDLLRKAQDVAARIKQATPPETLSGLPARRDLRGLLHDANTRIDPALFPMAELARPNSDPKVRRSQPKLLAPLDVRALAGFGAIAISERDLGRERFETGRSGGLQAMFAKSEQKTFAPEWQGDYDPNEIAAPSAPSGNPATYGAAVQNPMFSGNQEGASFPVRTNRQSRSRRSANRPQPKPNKAKAPIALEPEKFALAVPAGAKLEGRYWVALVGLIPVREQDYEFHRALRDASKTYASDAPLYLYCDVERAELAPNGRWGEFELLDMDQAADDIAYWAAAYPELVDQRYLPFSVDVAEPLPPLALANHDPDRIRHPLIPLADASGKKQKTAPPPASTKSDAKAKSRRHRAPAGRKNATPAASAARVANRAPGQQATPQEKIEHHLLRFFDFSAKPGKTYRYRVRLALYNPNYGVAREYLADEKLASASEIFTDWSEPTAAVRVSSGYELLAGEIDPAEPKAKVLVRHFDPVQGRSAVRIFQLPRGATANANAEGAGSPPARIDPRTNEPEPGKADIKTDATLIDLVGGAPLAGGPAGSKTPARLLMLQSDGELALLSETADAPRYSIESAKLEAATPAQQSMSPRR